MLSVGDRNNVGSCSKPKILLSLVDICIVGLAALVLLIFKLFVTPYTRGFYCDDDSIRYPFKNSTVTSTTLYTTGFAINLVLIFLFEFIHYRYGSKNASNESTTSYTSSSQVGVPESTRRKVYQYLYNVYQVSLPFVFGVVVQQLTTNIGKFSIGRLRPHFLSVCLPDQTKYNCNIGYITEDVCTGDASRIHEARLSFPSGHASFSSFSMIFAILYIQARMQWRSISLLRPLLQMILFHLAFYTCLSRVSDYKHHWSDVLSGAIIGIVTAVLVVFKVLNLFEVKPKRDIQSATPVLGNMLIQRPDQGSMGVHHFTETPAPGPLHNNHNHSSLDHLEHSKGYINSHFLGDEGSGLLESAGTRQRVNDSRNYPQTLAGRMEEGEISTQVYYIDAQGRPMGEMERKTTLSKMTTQL
uniref:Phospholipid phosphatase 1-like n=1 Tax=Crassostrea virginica TaxID=6565 RepID=A0A8B8C6W8_CRAVI|nr:phospholipid phosphatase 1-like [Crassostrea virginica]